jgi:hypothetical protein
VAKFQWRPTRTHLIAGALVVAGFWLSSLSWWFFILVGLGALGPGVLRELGWLHDEDEFQRQADHRAGFHAFLCTSLVAFVFVAFLRSGERAVEDTSELATFFLALLWFSWFLSSLLSYWGAQKTAARILVAFGSAWLVFAVLSNIGSEWTGWAALLLHPLLAAPFFVLAWLSRRWPRVSGVLLLAASVFFMRFLGLPGTGNLGLMTNLVTGLLFVGPLLASGVALLSVRGADSAAR